MGNTSPWAATNRRASLISLDKLQAASRKQQAASFKLRQSVIYASGTGMVIWSRAARELVSTIRSKPCEACIRGEAGGSSQQKGNLCKNLHLSLTTKNSKWRTRSTSTVYRTTLWAQPTNISTFLKALGSVHGMAAQPIPGSGTEEISSINITAPAQAGVCDKLSRVTMPHRHKRQAASVKQQASSCDILSRVTMCQEIQASSGKRQARSSKRQASSRERQAPGPCVLHKVSRS